MKKYTTEPAKAYLNSVTEIIRNLSITENQGQNLLDQRNELISKCRHKNKFKFKTNAWKVSKFRGFFWCKFFPAFGLNMETYVSSVFTQNVV